MSHKAKQALEDLDVEVKLNTRITDVNALGITTEDGFIETENVIWAAGTRGHDFVRSLGAESDRSGRILVDAFCNIADHPEVFVIGDAAAYADGNSLLPAVAQVAMQQGKYVAGLIKSGVEGADRKPFKYKDKGSMAVIGRNRAVLQSGRLRLWGYPAWLIWMVLHILVIVEFRNRFRVLAEWLWYYTTRRHGTRLITGRRFPGN